MTFLVLLLVALILLWTPWRTGYPQEGLAPWVDWAGRRGGDWLALLAILSLLLPLGLLPNRSLNQLPQPLLLNPPPRPDAKDTHG